MWQYLNVIHAIKVLSPHLLACFFLPATEKNNSSYIIFKKMWYPLKNSLAVKKGAALCKMASMKEAVKYRWQPRNGCDDRSVTKILITTIQVNIVLISNEAGMRQHKFTWMVIIKILSQTYHHSHFLAATCMYFTTFFIATSHFA